LGSSPQGECCRPFFHQNSGPQHIPLFVEVWARVPAVEMDLPLGVTFPGSEHALQEQRLLASLLEVKGRRRYLRLKEGPQCI
jgi:hypothetical protein